MSMELRIYEHGKRVGIVDIDTETYEYEGENDEIRRVLDQMTSEGYTARVSRHYTADDGMQMKGTEKYKRTGAGLGRLLLDSIESKGQKGEVRTEAVGFGREYPTIEVGDYPDSESADNGTQSEDTSTDSQEEASTSKEPAPSNPSG